MATAKSSTTAAKLAKAAAADLAPAGDDDKVSPIVSSADGAAVVTVETAKGNVPVLGDNIAEGTSRPVDVQRERVELEPVEKSTSDEVVETGVTVEAGESQVSALVTGSRYVTFEGGILRVARRGDTFVGSREQVDRGVRLGYLTEG